MSKEMVKNPTRLFPFASAMVTCVGKEGKPNIISVGYITFACYDPPIIGVGVGTTRYSNKLLRETNEFVVNLPKSGQELIMDYCGFVSGYNVDKFKQSGLTPSKGTAVSAPLIKECPINYECKVMKVIPLGTHDFFLGEVVATHVEEQYVGQMESYIPIILLSQAYRGADDSLAMFGESGGCPV